MYLGKIYDIRKPIDKECKLCAIHCHCRTTWLGLMEKVVYTFHAVFYGQEALDVEQSAILMSAYHTTLLLMTPASSLLSIKVCCLTTIVKTTTFTKYQHVFLHINSVTQTPTMPVFEISKRTDKIKVKICLN